MPIISVEIMKGIGEKRNAKISKRKANKDRNEQWEQKL